MPNIVKVFNPNLIGYAYGDSLAEERFSQFNVAEVGALARDLPFMAKELVKRIKTDERVNVTEDWKVNCERKKTEFRSFSREKNYRKTYQLSSGLDDNHNDGFEYVLLAIVLRRHDRTGRKP